MAQFIGASRPSWILPAEERVRALLEAMAAEREPSLKAQLLASTSHNALAIGSFYHGE